jgi:hypothetical protein
VALLQLLVLVPTFASCASGGPDGGLGAPRSTAGRPSASAPRADESGSTTRAAEVPEADEPPAREIGVGAWGNEPWDNDQAADWFGDLWGGTPIVDRVVAALGSGDRDEMFAAMWMCTQLCRVYVWPIERLDETLAAAIAAGEQLLAGADADDITEQVETYLAELRSRLDTSDDPTG